MAVKAASRATQLLNPDKRIRMDGKGYSVMAKTRAQLNRAARQDSLRELLSQQGHEQHLIDTIEKLSDPDLEFDSLWIQRLKASADLRLKLMAKYIPDLKSTELTGAEGGDLVLQIQRKRFDGDD